MRTPTCTAAAAAAVLSTVTVICMSYLAPQVLALNAFTPVSTSIRSTKTHNRRFRISPPSSLFNTQLNRRHRILTTRLSNTDKDDMDANEKAFWAKQKAIAAQFEFKADESLRKENQEKFAKRRQALTSDTFYFSILIASALWILFPNPFVTLSYLFGTLLGTAYSFGLGKYVESIGTLELKQAGAYSSSMSQDEGGGAGVGQARLAFLFLLVLFIGKYRSSGLLEIPSITGFFTYQLASLAQGLRDFDE